MSYQNYQGGPPPPAGFMPGGYPTQGGYPGYPTQPGYPPGFQPPPPGSGYPPGGFPAPPAFHLPPDMSNVESGYGGGANSGAFAFSDKSIRMGFIRKVYSILMVQIAVTVAIIALFTFHEGTKVYVRTHPGLWWLAMIFMFATMITLACCGDVRRKAPMNFICLGIFTLAEGFLLGCATSMYKREEVFYAAAITLVVTVALTVFAFQTSIDFTGLCGVLFIATIVLLVIGILMMFFPSRTLKFIYAGFGALLFSIYIIYDTQMMMGGNHKYSIGPEEYIFAALNLYVDIVTLFLMILQLLGLLGSSDD
ncbi:protein lifeguard 1-like isoform X2 [Macrosteles quadrilineatus]|uniref:protein lifeguard 1-like isoform X2 n=1 Tax=Macrosteles quadrilineatus TaxID=74068 RepID=UPI0023E18B4E|nr:protein lifeguard 1-like isoform X2 [Macrosteles quadrilineatus]